MSKSFHNFLFLFVYCVVSVSHAHHLVPFQYPGISGKWGYKDTVTNQVILYWHFDAAEPFGADGLARVKVDNKFGCIDTAGVIVIPIQYRNLSSGFKNDTLYCSEKSKNIFYVRKQGVFIKYNVDFQVKEKEPQLNQLTRIKVFKYPKDSALCNLLWRGQMNDNWPTYRFTSDDNASIYGDDNSQNFQRRKYFNLISGIGINTAYQPLVPVDEPNSPFNFTYIDVNYSRFINSKLNKRSLYGLGVSYCRTVSFGDSFSYRNKQLSLDFLNRFYLAKGFYLHMTVSPVVNSDVKYKSRIPNTNQSWKNFPTQNSRISAGFSFGFGFNVIERLEFLANYQYVPNPFNNNRIRSNFLEFGAFINLE